MLYIDYGETTFKPIHDIDGYYETVMSEDWFNDEYVRELVKGIDDSVVENAHSIVHEYFGLHNCYEISTGCKAAILLYKTDVILDGCRMGDNCYKFVSDISKTKDVRITLGYTPDVPEDIVATIVNTGVVAHGEREFLMATFKAKALVMKNGNND